MALTRNCAFASATLLMAHVMLELKPHPASALHWTGLRCLCTQRMTGDGKARAQFQPI